MSIQARFQKPSIWESPSPPPPCLPALPAAEVVEFCRYLAPSPPEQAARQAAIDRIEAVVTAIWPAAQVQVFGSFATGE